MPWSTSHICKKKQTNMELINYTLFQHSILIDKCCLMEYSIIKDRNLHYGVINRIDDFRNSIGFDKPRLMKYSMSIVKSALWSSLKMRYLTLWSTLRQCNIFVLWSPLKISYPKSSMPFCKFYLMEYSICMHKIQPKEYSR